ncbi:EF-hand [Ostertagia ostertagi]
MFSQISDSSGFLEYDRFTDFMQQVLALTTAVFEAPTFGFSEAAVSQCFVKIHVLLVSCGFTVTASDGLGRARSTIPLFVMLARSDHLPVFGTNVSGAQIINFAKIAFGEAERVKITLMNTK